MLVARAKGPDGRTLLVIGLTLDNLKKLTSGNAGVFDADFLEVGKFDVMVVYGDDHEAVVTAMNNTGVEVPADCIHAAIEEDFKYEDD